MTDTHVIIRHGNLNTKTIIAAAAGGDDMHVE